MCNGVFISVAYLVMVLIKHALKVSHCIVPFSKHLHVTQ